jgi:hypothetical protein
MITRYENIFSQDQENQIIVDVFGANWAFGHGSRQGKRNYPFWIMPLKNNSFYSKDLLNIIQEKTQQEYELYDVYANGHTFGTMGDFHTDWHNSRGRTFLYYANHFWKPEYCGKTIFNVNGELQYESPTPRTAILFPGEIPHMAEGVSRSFNGLRVTIAWKLILK